MTENIVNSLKTVIALAKTIDAKANANQITLTIARMVLEQFLGDAWADKWVSGKKAPTDFFKNDMSTDLRRAQHYIRIIHLAEMLVNLQLDPNFASILARLKDGEVEPTYTELEVGKLLTFNERKFRYNKPQGKLGSDYDLETFIDGHTVCVDAKCKLETTEDGENTLFNTLQSGRKQLPEDRPGALVVKLPQTWDEEGKHLKIDAMQKATDRFFANSARVVSVGFYFSLALEFSPQSISPMSPTREFANAKHRFDKAVDWRILRPASGADGPIGPPKGWIDLAKLCA